MINYLLYFLLGLFWSGSYLAIKVAVTSLSPVYSALLRVAIAFICFTLLLLHKRQHFKVPLVAARKLWMIGFFLQGLPFLLLFWGEQFVAPALAGIINSTVPLWILVLSLLLFHDSNQMNIRKVTGLVLGSLGVLSIFWPVLMAHNASKALGILAILGMAISYALGGILSQRFHQSAFKISFRLGLWHQHLSSFLFLLIYTMFFGSFEHSREIIHTPTLFIALLYLGVISTAAAWLIYQHLIAAWGALRTSSVLYLIPPLAIIWDYLFFHLVPAPHVWIGIVVILLGVALVQYSRRTV